MKKLIPVQELMAQAEAEGRNPDRLFVNPSEVFVVGNDNTDPEENPDNFNESDLSEEDD